jgi:hypothetical protein
LSSLQTVLDAEILAIRFEDFRELVMLVRGKLELILQSIRKVLLLR